MSAWSKLWALIALLLPGLSAAHETGAPSLAASAVVDATGTLWVVSEKSGRVWVQRASGGIEALSVPVAVNEAPLRIIARGENRPKVAVTPTGVVIVTFTTASPGRFAGHVWATHSTDGGQYFSPPVRLNDDARDISHRFDSLIVEGSGRVRVVWLDARDGGPGASLYTAWSDDDGATWSHNQRLARSTCECCRVALALDPNGISWALWRHVFDGNIRDHARMAVGAAGAPLQRATFSNWQLDACPHQGPALAIAPSGVSHLAWFAGGAHGGLYYSQIDADGAQVLSHRLADAGTSPAIALEGEQPLIAWLRFDGTHTVLEVARPGGPPRVLARTRGAADYPQWISRAGQLAVFWRTGDEGFQLIAVPKE